MTNPQAAIDSILASEAKVGEIEVYPVTLARYGLLELVKSPFVSPKDNVRQYDYIDTVYIMTQPAQQLRGYNSTNIDALQKNAFDFADTLDANQTDIILMKILEQMKLMQLVAPESTDESGKQQKKAQTAGC